MDQSSLMQHFRNRLNQMLVWFVVSHQTQHQYTQSDRQQHDGTLRGLDDPDARQRQAWGTAQGVQDTQAQQRQFLEQQHRAYQQRQQRGVMSHGRR